MSNATPIRPAHSGMTRLFLVGLAAAGLVAACDKVTPPHWTRISAEAPCAADCKRVVFFLDSANVTSKGGLLYVTLQTRIDGEAAGEFGISHAEANCRSSKLERTALQEDRYSPIGLKIGKRLTTISAQDEAAIVKYACSSR